LHHARVRKHGKVKHFPDARIRPNFHKISGLRQLGKGGLRRLYPPPSRWGSASVRALMRSRSGLQWRRLRRTPKTYPMSRRKSNCQRALRAEQSWSWRHNATACCTRNRQICFFYLLGSSFRCQVEWSDDEKKKKGSCLTLMGSFRPYFFSFFFLPRSKKRHQG